MGYFENKTAVVTGAGSGIGRALAEALNAAGCSLELSDINPHALEQTRAALKRDDCDCHCSAVDVANRATMEKWADDIAGRRGHVDIVINNAGVGLGGTAEENSIEDIEWLMGINFWGVVYGSKFFLPLLRRSPAGHLVNISSIFGIIGVPTQSAYNASKFAVRGYTEALRQELADSTVHVCCVHPGGVKTNIARAARSGSDAAEADRLADRFEELARTTPDSAAEQILGAIEKRKPRLLIGSDARVVSLISRLFPTRYPRILRWLGGKELADMVATD